MNLTVLTEILHAAGRNVLELYRDRRTLVAHILQGGFIRVVRANMLIGDVTGRAVRIRIEYHGTITKRTGRFTKHAS